MYGDESRLLRPDTHFILKQYFMKIKNKTHCIMIFKIHNINWMSINKNVHCNL